MGEGRTEYTISNQHNGYTLDGYVLRRTYFNSHIGSLGQSLYEDGQWHSTSNVPHGVKLQQFETSEAAMQVARNDAAQRGLKETQAQPDESTAIREGYYKLLAKAGFSPTGTDFNGKHEHRLRIDANDGGTFELLVFRSAEDTVGLHAYYEKNNIINAARTIDASFNSLREVLERVDGYRQLAVHQDNAEAPEVFPANGVQGFVFSIQRMR